MKANKKNIETNEQGQRKHELTLDRKTLKTQTQIKRNTSHICHT